MTLNTTPIQTLVQVQHNLNHRICLCGCGGQPKGGKFIPGHDARSKGQLLRAYRANGEETAEARQIIIHLGWGRYIGESVPAGETTSLVVRVSLTCNKGYNEPVIEQDDVIRISTAPTEGSFLAHHQRWFSDAEYQARCRAEYSMISGSTL